MEKKNNTKYWIIILILIIVILLLLFFARFGKIENKNNLIPTGNVNVFDIDVRCCCTQDGSCDKKNCTDKNNNTLPVYKETYYKDVIGEVFVDDNSGEYVYQQNLRIFENSAFEFEDKIAPGVSNTYHFVVHNSTNAKMKYKINMYEDTEYPINLRYRLRIGDNYVIGGASQWVSAKELQTAFKQIDASSSDNYALDWQWMYEGNKDKQDTNAGENMTSSYKLNIRFMFEQVGE